MYSYIHYIDKNRKKQAKKEKWWKFVAVAGIACIYSGFAI